MESHPLTRSDINILKMAAAITFTHDAGDLQWGRVGQGRIILPGCAGYFTVKSCIDYISENEGHDKERLRLREVRGYHLHSAALQDDAWKTILSLLKVGDELELEWYRCNPRWIKASSGPEVTGLWSDALRVIIKRPSKTKNGDQLYDRFTFNLYRHAVTDVIARLTKLPEEGG